ncbi:MFS transporter [Streptomyces albicerus]|uniref:MFS transporter n=1 Tax=Streptomyces albicerus TaxID=2569859 RepID=UPI001CEC571B|nr:MFS transporter [Streptomyces albicerus]
MTTRPAFRDPNVLRWLGAYTTSVTGDVAYFMALSWAAARAAGPAQVGAVLAAGAIPRAVLMLGGGVLADRFGPRRVLIGSDLARCGVVLGAAALTWADSPQLWLLYAMALVFGAVDAVFMPAVGALPPRLTDQGQLARVQGMRVLSVRFSNAVGPLIGSFALAVQGAAGAFAVVGVLFGVSLGLLMAVRTGPVAGARPTRDAETGPARTDPPSRPNELAPHGDVPNDPAPHGHGPDESAPLRRDPVASAPRRRDPDEPEPRRPLSADLRDGLRYLRGDRRLRRLVWVIALGEMCFSGPLAAGLVLLADERGWSAATLGWILAAFSVGGAVSALTMAAARRVPRAGAVLAGSLVVTAGVVVALGRVATPGAAVALGGLLGTVSGVAMVLGNALLQKEAEPRYLGRVTSVTTLCTLGLSPLLYPLTGLVAAAWGTAVFFAGCGAICVLAAATALTPPLRGVRL